MMIKIKEWLSFQWKKEYRKWFTFFGLLIFLIWLVQRFSTQNLILIETALILFWYARETYDLKQNSNKQIKETRKQTYLRSRPFIRIQWEGPNQEDIVIKNEGFGVAVDLEIIFDLNIGKMTAKKRPVMASGSNVSETRITHDDLGLNHNDFLNKFFPDKNNYEVTLKYKDITNNNHFQKFKVNNQYNDKFELIEWDIPEDFKK